MTESNDQRDRIRIGRAVLTGQLRGAQAALEAVEELHAERVERVSDLLAGAEPDAEAVAATQAGVTELAAFAAGLRSRIAGLHDQRDSYDRTRARKPPRLNA